MPSGFKSSITKDGNFFRKNPVKTWRDNVTDFMVTIADEGDKDVTGQLRAGQGGRQTISAGVQPARVADHVVGRVRSLSGKQWKATAVVSVNSRGLSGKQARALMAAASSLESRIHAFRKTTGRLRRAKANLLKGLQ
jgi:hypothetical protein